MGYPNIKWLPLNGPPNSVLDSVFQPNLLPVKGKKLTESVYNQHQDGVSCLYLSSLKSSEWQNFASHFLVSL